MINWVSHKLRTNLTELDYAYDQLFTFMIIYFICLYFVLLKLTFN